MRASIKNYTDALKQQRIERGEDGGFSLIELIIVVVILGILAAIAIPIFLNISGQAKDNSVKAITANAATQAAASIAQGTAPASVSFTNLTNGTNPAVALSISVTDSTKPLDTFCVSGSGGGSVYTVAVPYKSGPGC